MFMSHVNLCFTQMKFAAHLDSIFGGTLEYYCFALFQRRERVTLRNSSLSIVVSEASNFFYRVIECSTFPSVPLCSPALSKSSERSPNALGNLWQAAHYPTLTSYISESYDFFYRRAEASILPDERGTKIGRAKRGGTL